MGAMVNPEANVRSNRRPIGPPLSLGLLMVTAIACNLGNRPTPLPTEPIAPPTDPPAATVTIQASPSPSPETVFDLAGIDPCSLVTAEQVGAALGAQVEALPPGTGDQVPVTCGYSTPDFSAFVTIQLYQDPAGKRSLLDLYGQLAEAQACSYSVSFTTEDITPTPLPDEIEAHVGKGLDEIYRMYWEANRRFCGDGNLISELMPWPELGPQANTSKSMGGLGGGSITSGAVQVLHPDAVLEIQVTGTVGVIDEDLLDRYEELRDSESSDPAEVEQVGQELFEQLDGLVEIAQAIARAAFSSPD